MDDEPEEVKQLTARLEQDSKAAALAYATKASNIPLETRQQIAQAFIDGASWMMDRTPQTMDAMMAAYGRASGS